MFTQLHLNYLNHPDTHAGFYHLYDFIASRIKYRNNIANKLTLAFIRIKCSPAKSTYYYVIANL